MQIKPLNIRIGFGSIRVRLRVRAMALGAKEAATYSIFSSFPPTSLHPHSSNKSLSSIKFGAFKSPLSLKFTLYNHHHTSKRSSFQLQSAAESLTTVAEEEGEEKIEKSGNPNSRRKLFVLNLPWSFSVADIKTLFSECGAVSDVEVRIEHFFLVYVCAILLNTSMCMVLTLLWNFEDYKAERWEEQGICVCYDGFWWRCSGCYREVWLLCKFEIFKLCDFWEFGIFWILEFSAFALVSSLDCGYWYFVWMLSWDVKCLYFRVGFLS